MHPVARIPLGWSEWGSGISTGVNPRERESDVRQRPCVNDVVGRSTAARRAGPGRHPGVARCDGRGGRNDDRHLNSIMHIVDDDGPAADANVTANLDRDDRASWPCVCVRLR